MHSGWERGGHTEFRALIDKYGGGVMALARSYAADGDDQEDLAQEVWIRIYNRKERFDGRESALAWIMTVARHVCLTWQRRRKRRQHVARDFAALSASDAPDLPGDGQLDQIHQQRRFQQSLCATLELPTRQRDAILFRYVEGLSPEETAVRLGCEKSTVRSLIRHGLLGLRAAREEVS